MKKTLLTVLLLSFVSITNAQWWNELSRFENMKMISSSNDVYTFSTTKLTQIPYDHVFYKYAFKERQEFFQVPIQVYDDYLIGEKCFNYGKAFIIFGSISTLIGGCVYAIGTKHNKINTIKTGTGIMCGGSTLIGISIPLLCFGDNMKRATNREYKIYKKIN